MRGIKKALILLLLHATTLASLELAHVPRAGERPREAPVFGSCISTPCRYTANSIPTALPTELRPYGIVWLEGFAAAVKEHRSKNHLRNTERSCSRGNLGRDAGRHQAHQRSRHLASNETAVPFTVCGPRD